MSNFWDYSNWGTINIVAVLLLSLIVATILKNLIPLLHKSLIPTSVLGGFILLIIAGIYKTVTGQFFFDRQRAIFEIPLMPDDNEKEKAQQLINEITAQGLTLSVFLIENKTLEQIYMETIG